MRADNDQLLLNPDGKVDAQAVRREPLWVMDEGGLHIVIDMAMTLHRHQLAQQLSEAGRQPVLLRLSATSSVYPFEVLATEVCADPGPLSPTVLKGIARVHADGRLPVIVVIGAPKDERWVLTGLDPDELEDSLDESWRAQA